jgi:hypothetical protein
MGERSVIEADFAEDLKRSHDAEDLPFWEETYRKAFPGMLAMLPHPQDGDHQRQGIDRSIIMANSKQILIDEKVRFRNRKTGRVYEDIALEYLSDRNRNVPGWVCKPLLADYIAYAIAPLGKCYLLPVIQLQEAWRCNGERWLLEAENPQNPNRRIIAADNCFNGRRWTTLSVPVTPQELFPVIGACLRVQFTPFDPDKQTKSVAAEPGHLF